MSETALCVCGHDVGSHRNETGVCFAKKGAGPLREVGYCECDVFTRESEPAMTTLPTGIDEMPDYTPADAFGLLRSYTRHLAYVRLALTVVQQGLERRALAHDASKMLDDEFAGFARINAAARVNKFGSPEYSESMQRERMTILKHFGRNTHHPEYFTAEVDPDGWRVPADKMSFLDIIEMVCDWWGARKGYDDPRPWPESVKLNLDSKGKYLSAEQLWLAGEVAAFLAAEADNG